MFDKETLDKFKYKVLKAGKKTGRPSLKYKLYIEYEDGEVTTVDKQSIKNNTFYRHKQKVYGIGIADYSPDSEPEVIEKWNRMLCRSVMVEMGYTSTRSSSTIDSYTGVTIEESWLRFSTFEKWILSKNWKGNDLDKDIIGDGTHYSEQPAV